MLNRLFTIVIPALNEEVFTETLDDLISRHNNFEVIVVDGNSEDATVAKCKEYENKLPSLEVITTKKRNVSHQRNLGAKKAKADWIVFMDADNRLPKYFLDGIKYRILKEKPDCFTTYCADGYNNPTDDAIIRFINLGMELSRQVESPLAFDR
jgi:glycosyltransferase involved in cell wall biosynthesis